MRFEKASCRPELMFEGGEKTGPKSGQFSKATDNRNIEQKRKKEIKVIFLGSSRESWGNVRPSSHDSHVVDVAYMTQNTIGKTRQDRK